MDYKKPQSTLVQGGAGIYPLTTADQVILADGSRLEKDGKINVDSAANASKLGGKAPEYYIQPRNLLDNSDFRNPVNQRGQTSYTGGYTIDRWVLYGADNLTINNGYITVSGDLYQYIPVDVIPDGMYTVCACKRDGTIVTFSRLSTAGVDWYNGLAFGLDSYGEKIAVGLRSGEYVWAALYEGSYTADTLPPYVPKGYEEELFNCLYSFQRHTFSQYQTICTSYQGPEYCFLNFPLYRGMRGFANVTQTGGAITVGSGTYTFSGQNDATRCIMIIGQNYETINNSAGSAYSYTANPEGVTIDISCD